MARLNWQEFEDALARRPLACWWRDDDAAAPTPSLRRLLQLSEKHAIPLALAVIPEAAEPELFRHLHGHVSVLQHGTDHRNRAAPGAKKTEYPAEEPMEQALARIADGFGRLRAFAGAKLEPVLAPPWNRVRADLLKKLPAIGIRGVSGYGKKLPPVPGLRQLNTHLDIIDWKGSRGFVGEAHVFSTALQSEAPVGLLTHHAVHDEAAWKFLERLFTLRDIRWLSASEAFSYTGPAHG